MRNKIVHDYENIDFSVLWGTIIKSLPLLKEQIEGIIKEQTETIDVLAEDNFDV